MDEWEEGSWGGWGNTEFQVAMRSDTEGLDEGSLLSALKMLSLKASVPRHPAHWIACVWHCVSSYTGQCGGETLPKIIGSSNECTQGKGLQL